MDRRMWLKAGAAALLGLAAASPGTARVADAHAERTKPNEVTVGWTAAGPVDVLLARTPDGDAAGAAIVSANDRDGHATIPVDPDARPYFLLRDRDGSTVRVAERIVPLTQGSNFRDVGGYPSANGKHVRWGLLYRSGATAMLTPEDVARVRALGLRSLVDLRSDEERVLAPTRIDGVPYTAVGYSMTKIIATMNRPGAAPDPAALYRALPIDQAPQLRVLFATLLRREGPVEYNCSAGQDRTGFATAMILSALGVPREVIVEDYHLSTRYRQTAFEMPPINAAAYPGEPIAQMFAKGQQQQQGQPPRKPTPLYDQDGKSLLLAAFAAIEQRWGSVDAYLDKELGVGPVQIAALRAAYLE